MKRVVACLAIGAVACGGATATPDSAAPDATPPPTIVQDAYLKASNPDFSDGFGIRVALSADGSTVAVASPTEDSGGDQSDESMGDAGAVYVFDCSAIPCTQQAYVKASSPGFGDHFGEQVALSADGSTLAVGAPGEGTSSGAVYVLARDDGAWSQQAYLKASNTDEQDWFGAQLALSSDGTTLAVGAPLEDSGSANDPMDDSLDGSGAVYLFTRDGATWTERAYLKASNLDMTDQFGSSLALSADGSALAVQAVGESSAATGVNGDETDDSAQYAGAVYAFVREGLAWSQEAYIKGSNTQAHDQLGSGLSMSADGTMIAFGAIGETLDGAVHVFAFTPTGWLQQARIVGSNTEAGDWFGLTVGLSGDGATLAVGAVGESSASSGIGGDEGDNSSFETGAAYVFDRDGSTWTQRAYVKASNAGPADRFGEGLALSADGSTIVVGAYQEQSSVGGVDGNQNDDSIDQAGAAYRFDLAPR